MTAGIRFVVGAMLAVLFSALFSVDVHAQPAATRVAVLGADTDSRREDVRARLAAQGLDVTPINVTFGTTNPTPTRDELLAYQAVFTWASAFGSGYADPDGLGNALAAYVDAGGGVVQAAHGLSLGTSFRLGGAWRAGGYEAITPSAANNAGLTSLVAIQPAHPILSGVTTVGAAAGGVQHNPMLQGCGTELIANWSNGRLLAAARVGPRGGRIVSLNMYPVSSPLGTGGWTGDGAVMMANAIRFVTTPAPAPPAGAPAVAVFGATDTTWIDDVRCKIQDTHLFSRVDAFDVSVGTPNLATLNQYDAVLTFSDVQYADSTAMGNVLADYVDGHRGVVEASNNFDPVNDLDGRWSTDGYRPFTEAPVVSFTEGSLVPILPGHQILQGVASVLGGAVSYHSSPVAPSSAMTLVANWTDGQPFVVAGSGPAGGSIVGLNFFPPSSTVGDGFWDAASDGARLMANALLYASNRTPSTDAGADQTIEAASPAGVSFSLNGTGSDLDGDPITFAWSGAATGNTASMMLDVPPPVAPATSQTYTMTLTVSDGRGGVSTDDVNLTVTDTTGPVVSGVPAGPIDLVATSPAGAVLTYGPVTAADAVDGVRPVTCNPASGSTIPVGGTVVTCTSTDTRGNTSSSSFNVTVTADDGGGDGDDSTPGKVYGYGFIRDDDTLFEFSFNALESASGFERGELQMSTKSGYCYHHRHSRRSQNRFVSLALDEVTFNGNSSVQFSGTGRWNGRNGYRFAVSASDTFVRYRHFDRVHITITSPTGEVVSEVEGKLQGGNVQFVRVRHQH